MMAAGSKGFLHKGISRLQAEETLLSAHRDGSFLVRESETIAGAYTLCLLHLQKVHQYRILPDEKGMIFVQAEKGVQQRKFNDLTQLIQEYVQRGDKNGLVCGLTHAISSSDVTEESKEESDEEEAGPVYNADNLCPPPPIPDNGNIGLLGMSTHPLIKHMRQRFSQIDLSNFDGEFVDDLKCYSEDKVLLDEHIVKNGGDQLNHLRKLLGSAARSLNRQLELYFAKLDAIRHLFGPITTPPLSSPVALMQTSHATDTPLQNILDRLNICCKAVANLERKAGKKLLELSDNDNHPDEDVVGETMPCVPRRKSPGSQPIIPASAFDAKIIKLGKQGKVKLTVDIQSGKLLCVKPSKDVLDESNVFSHDKIEQLIKHTANNCRLDIKIQNRKKETYVFDNLRERENFCQLMQQLKNIHSATQEVENLSLFIGTWNMGEEHPPWNLGPWLKSQGLGKSRCPTLSLIPHDLYVIGTQESALSEKEWTHKLKACMMDHFGIEMHTVICVSLWAIRIVVLVKPEYKNKLSHVQHSSVKTGIANALGNKGAVGVSFYFNGSSFCFINSHLTSGHEKNHRRNANFRDIIKGLNLKPKGPQSLFDITNQFHHIFFLGDLNYRLEGLEPQEIIRIIMKEKNYPYLLEHDQLKKTQYSKKAFVGFCEEDITFPPTYRIERGTTQQYIWQKFKKTGVRINAPSWCDRIMWKSYPETYIRNVSYGSVETILTSDHKPVFAAFDVSIIGQFTSTKGDSANSNGDVKIVFEAINVEIKTSGRENFRLEFHSACLEAPVLGGQNCKFGSQKARCCCPIWTAAELPQLQPIFDNRDYLEDQHLLLAVKTADGLESYGECVLALKGMFASKPQPFFAALLHLGEETGRISGMMHVRGREGSAPDLHVKKSRRSYELIYMDTDSLFMEKEGSLSRATGQRLSPAIARSYVTDADKAKREKEHPSPTPRKPRMGQSSLVQTQAVMPVSNPRAAQRSDGPIYNNDSMRPAAAVTHEDQPKMRESNSSTRRHGLRDSTAVSIRDNPLYEDQVYQEATSTDRESGASEEPPTPPPRKYLTDEVQAEYAILRSPSSINEWLLNLGLPQYIQCFFAQGFESMNSLGDVDEIQLMDMDIEEAHRERILKSIREMKESSL